MARGKHGETLQAVEIEANTFIGIAANYGGPGETVHLLEDGNLTFHFRTGDKVISGASAGMDFISGASCTGITSTAEVII